MSAPSKWSDIQLDDAPPGGWLDGGSVDLPGVGQLHLYAILVQRDEETGYQSAVDPQMETELENLSTLVGSSIETVSIEGWPGEYAIYGLPFGD